MLERIIASGWPATAPASRTKAPLRVVASQAAMADAGIAWLFETMARCIGSGVKPDRRKVQPANELSRRE